MRLDFESRPDFSGLREVEKRVFHLSGGDNALFIVDMNMGFALEGALSSELIRKIVPDVVETAKLFFALGAPVIAFTDRHSADSPEFLYLPPHCVAGTDESELVDELKEFGDKMTVIGKNSTNGFMEDEARQLIDDLIKKGCKNWFVIGCCTDICVKTLAISLKTYFNSRNLDMNVIVPVNAVETYDSSGHGADIMNLFALYDMQQNGIQLVSRLAP
jgi:nicotinamidase-related amidase